MTTKQSAAARKLFLDADKKTAVSDAEEARLAVREKTAKLRALRLEREASQPAEKPKPRARRKAAPRKRT